MMIGGAQGGNIALSNLVDGTKIPPAPCKRLFAEGSQENIGCQPAVATIAVWKRMNPDELMMEPGRDFIERECFVLDPVFDVIEQLPQFRFDLIWLYADRPVMNLAEFSSPFPNIAIHAVV